MGEKKGSVLFFGLSEGVFTSVEEKLSNTGLDIFNSSSLEEAYAILEKEKPAIVLTEYSIKNAEVEFLKQVRGLYPSVCRAILCEEQEQKEIVKLLVKGIVTCYFGKKHGIDFLEKTLLHVLDTRGVLRNKRLLKVVKSIERLPIIPGIYHEFLKAIERDSSIKEIASILTKDTSIAAKILQIANSAFYGAKRMASVTDACLYLGEEIIKDVVFIVSLSNAKRLSGKSLQYLELIVQHSLNTNRHFHQLCKKETGNRAPEEFASIGLTHDIGKIIMLLYLPDRYSKIIDYQQRNTNASFYRSEIESNFEGCTHCEIGAYFLELWNFPEANVTAALFHNTPEKTPDNYVKYLKILDLANKDDQKER